MVRSLAFSLALLATTATAAGHGSAAASRSVVCPVLIYHHIKWTEPRDDAIERGLTIFPNQFEAQLVAMHAAGYTPISAARVVRYLTQGGSMPRKPMVITFDDGYADMYTHAYPVLRRYNMTATFFVVPGLVGKPRYLSWVQIEDMARHGMDIEAHTMTHPDLTAVSTMQARGELTESKRTLELRLHHPVLVFAYPYGSYNAGVLAEVRHAGFEGAFTTRQGWVLREDQRLTLPRLYAHHDDTIPQSSGG